MIKQFTHSDRWSRSYLLEHIKDHYFGYYCLQTDWLYEEQYFRNKDTDFTSCVEIYKNPRLGHTLKIIECQKNITVAYDEGINGNPEALAYQIYFKLIRHSDCRGSDMFAFDGYTFNSGVAGERQVKRDLECIHHQLTRGSMDCSNMDRDAEIYNNCISMLKAVMEWTIYGMNTDPAQFPSQAKNLPLNHFQICQRLFWDGYQGGTNTREKLKQMLIDEDEKIAIDPEIFDAEEYEI
jgi:hypothetical protein